MANLSDDEKTDNAMRNEYEVDIQMYRRDYHPGPGQDTLSVWDATISVTHCSGGQVRTHFVYGDVDRTDKLAVKQRMLEAVNKAIARDIELRRERESNHYRYRVDADNFKELS